MEVLKIEKLDYRYCLTLEVFPDLEGFVFYDRKMQGDDTLIDGIYTELHREDTELHRVLLFPSKFII